MYRRFHTNNAFMNGKYHRLFLLLCCLAGALWRGRAVVKPHEITAVVVVLTGKLGDIVCGTPVLRAIRTALPRARIIAIGGSVLKPLLADSALADECLDIGDENIESRIRACHADAGIVTGPSFVSAALLYLAGIPLVVAARVEGGSSPSETRLYRILQRLIVTFPYRIGAYAPRERLRALEPLGIVAEDTRKQLGFSPTGEASVADFFSARGIVPGRDLIVGISPSAGNKIKEWPVERFAAVADYLAERHGAKIIITGGKQDAPKACEMLSHMHTPALDASGAFDLDALKALIARMSLFVSVDTGPIYIAEAFGVSTIDITGPIDENEQPPIGSRHRVVTPPERKRPEMFVLNACPHDAREARRQAESISVEAVVETIDALLRDVVIHAERT